jgi:hypothetical protein
MTNNDEQKKYNDSAKEILEKEKLIDPGNKHRHDAATEKGLNKENSDKQPPEPEGDAIDDGQKPE